MIVIPSVVELPPKQKVKKTKVANPKRQSIDSRVSKGEKNKCSIMDFNDYL